MTAYRHITLAVLAISLIGVFGANAAKDVSPATASAEHDDAFWIKTKLPADLMAGRLNVTTVEKTPRVPLPTRPPRKRERTAQLLR